MSLAVSRPDGAVRPYVNREFLDSLLEMARSYAARGRGAAAASGSAAVSVRGVVEIAEREETEAERQERAAAILGSFDRVAEELVDARRREGEHLEAIVCERLAEIDALMAEAAGLASLRPGKLKTRLAEQIRDLAVEASAVTDDRVAQEIALLLTKYDVREELDRIAAHVAQARALVEAGGAVGRRLDFLAQELNREANTVCAEGCRQRAVPGRPGPQDGDRPPARAGAESRIGRRDDVAAVGAARPDAGSLLAFRRRQDHDLAAAARGGRQSDDVRSRPPRGPPRPAERAGLDYIFVNDREFDAMRARDEFLEHAEVFEHRYGTPRRPVEEALTAGRDVLFDVDWQGAQQLAERARQDLVSIFVLPPSTGELERRLRARAQDSDEVVRRRMERAATR